MRRDALTGLPALSPSEVESLNPAGERIERVDWGRWPKLWGYVVAAAGLAPYRSVRTGEGLWGVTPELKRHMIVRTQYGKVEIVDLHKGLAALFDAQVGAPFRVEAGEGGGFDVTVGQADSEPTRWEPPSEIEAKPPSEIERLLAAAREVPIPAPPTEEEVREAELVANAEAIFCNQNSTRKGNRDV